VKSPKIPRVATAAIAVSVREEGAVDDDAFGDETSGLSGGHRFACDDWLANPAQQGIPCSVR